MMATGSLEQELLDFFAGRGRFAAREEHVGMAASGIPRLFAEYFQGLDAGNRRGMVNLLGGIALGTRSEHAEHVAEATHLLLDLVLRGFSDAFGDLRPALERELTDTGNVSGWREVGDNAPLPTGEAYRGDWHFALQLWGVLYLLRSSAAGAVYRQLAENAASGRFREALQRARAMYDSRPEASTA